jgi:hypothetical protein
MVQSFKIHWPKPFVSLHKAGGTMGLLGLALLNGCAGPNARSMGEAARTGPVTMLAHASSPKAIPANFSQTPAIGGVALAFDQVRCRAASSAVLAQLSEIERGLAAEFFSDSRCVSENMKCLQQELLMFRTIERGNEAATQALNLYVQLAEAESLRPILELSLEEIQSMRSDLAELKRQELPADMEPGPLDRQYLSTSEQQSTLKAGIAR